MATNDLAVTWHMAAAAVRATLSALGPATVLLRVCNGEAAGEEFEGLGLKTPAMESYALSPVMVRTDSNGANVVLVDASTLEEIVGVKGEGLLEILKLARVSIDGEESGITAISADRIGGAAYLYRLGLEA